MIFSCAESEPDVAEIQPSIVLTFDDETSKPSMSLSVLFKTLSNNNRTERFVIQKYGDLQKESESLSFEWFVENPIVYKTDSDMYVLAKNLKPISSRFDLSKKNIDSVIPKGKYKLIYEDAAGKSVERDFSVMYDEKILDSDSTNIRGKIGASSEYLSLFDEEGVVLFCGKPKNDWTLDKNINRDYKRATTKRAVYFTGSNKIVCLLPIKEIGEKNE